MNYALIGYSYFDFIACKLDRKSTNDMCHLLGNLFVSRKSEKQASVLLSMVKVEYVNVGSFCAQTI